MRRQRMLALIKTQYINLIRSPLVLGMMILLPIVLTLTFGVIFRDDSTGTGQNLFEWIVPGLFALNGLYMIMIVGTSFSEAKEQGVLKRINTTPTTSSEFMGSNIISNTSIAILQVAIIGTLCFLLGFKPDGAIIGMSFAFIFMVIFSLSAIGFGLITATISKNAGAAAGICWIFILPQQLLAARLYPLPDSTKTAAMFMPLHYASDAITLLFNGTALTDLRIWGDLIILLIFSLVIITLGILLFKKYGKA